MEQITIVPMTNEHLPFVTEIEKNCFSDPWTTQSFIDGMKMQFQDFFVALSGEDVVGYIVLMHIFEDGEILNLAVSPYMQKKGIASKLLTHSFNYLSSLGVTRITLEVRSSNTPAKKLYEKSGFSPISIRKNYYTFPLEDGIVMEKHL